MSFNKHRHGEYTSNSRHHFQNNISKIGGSAARDAYFVPKYRQKSPEPGGSAAGAYSSYFDNEHESEIEDYVYYQHHVDQQQLSSQDQYHHPMSKQYSSHYSHHGHSDHSLEHVALDYQHQMTFSRDNCYSKSESLSRHRQSTWVYTKSSNPETDHKGYNRSNKTSRRNETPCYRSSDYKNYEHHRSSHRSPGHCLPRKSHLRHDYRWRTTRTPSESPTRESRHSHRHTKYHSSSHHSMIDERHQGSRNFHSRHGDYTYSSTYRSRRHYSPTSSSCSSSDNESSNSDSQYTSDDSFYSSGLSPDDRYFSPERYCHQPCRRQLLHEKYRHDQNDRLYHEPRSLLSSETGKDKSYVDIMPEVEDQDNTDFKATRKLRAFNDTPVTSSSSFKQEFLHRLDNIKCMAKLLLSRSQTPPRTGFCNQPLNWRGLFL